MNGCNLQISKLYLLEDAHIWDTYFQRLPFKDVHYYSSYFLTFEQHRKKLGQLFIYEEGNDFVYYPFFLRQIEGTPYFDITSQYGYGGPLATTTNDEFLRRFRYRFQEYRQEANIITEFVRFHPLLRNHIGYEKELDVHSTFETVFVDVQIPYEGNYKRATRSAIRKAKQCGLTVEKLEGEEAIQQFYDIYTHTMIRRQADKYYYFSKDFLRNLQRNIRGQHTFYFVKKDNIYISTELVIQGQDYAHSYLGGTLEDYFSYYPNQLLKAEIIKDCERQGLLGFLLGGGEDNLVRYKKGFSTQGLHPFYIGKKVHYPEIYQQLIHNVEGNGYYFPAYRK